MLLINPVLFLFTDQAVEVWSRLFDHRPFLRGEIKSFVHNFQVRVSFLLLCVTGNKMFKVLCMKIFNKIGNSKMILQIAPSSDTIIRHDHAHY